VLEPAFMEFRILGSLEVRDRGRSIELRRKKPRALLAFLVLHAGEAVSSDALIDALWGEAPPRTARAALHNYVVQLRQALGPGLVASRSEGYVLEARPEQIDLGRFEQLVAEGRDAAADERIEKLREGLALWRGPPLGDLLFEPFAAHEADRLEELRTAALEDLVDAELAAANATGPDLVARVEQLVAQHPFRERLRGQLMLALYRSGRQAEALDAYQETRRFLVEELGIEPSPPLRELQQAILRQDPALAAPVRSLDEQAQSQKRRKTVTVLVADLSAPGDADLERLHGTTTRGLARVRTVLQEHGATVEQRAGDEVMAVFGIPTAHEDDALRAARAALELAPEIEALGGIELRVAIETGEVLAGVDETGHGFAAGPAVTLAKRMLRRVGPNEIVAGATTLRLLADSVVAETGTEGEARLLELADGGPAPRRQLQTPLVDRERELAAIRSAFTESVDERACRLFLVLGEAGIGKTRLAIEAAAQLGDDALVLVGRCVSYGRGATFLPLAEILRGLQEHHVLLELLADEEHADLIGARIRQLTDADEASGSGGETFWAIRRVFESLAAERPLVLVFEDLHWAEPTLLDLFDYLADQASGPILLLALARSEVLETRPAWRNVGSATLTQLSNAEGRLLLENLGDVPDELRTEILSRAAGNPLFIEQLRAHAREGGQSAELPPSLDALLVSRLDNLKPDELAVLQHAAVVGREFEREALAHLVEPGAPDLEPAVRKGFVHESRPGRFRFHHVLIRDAAYRTLPKAQRAELHRRFGRWLESRADGSDELIGFHLEQAHAYLIELEADDTDVQSLARAAGERLVSAGVRAAKIGDSHAASNLLTRAASLLEPPEVARRDLLTELALVHWRSGDLHAVEQSLTEARELAIAVRDARAELRARVELAYLTLFREPEGGTRELLSLTAEAIPTLERLGDDRTLGLIWYMRAHVHGGFQCRYGESADAAERAVEHYARAGWPVTPCLQELAVSLYFGPLPVVDGLRRCAALIERADRGGQAHVLVFRGGLEAMAGRFDEAREFATRGRARYEELDWNDKVWENYAAIAAEIELLAGEDASAEKLLAESCRRLDAWGEQARLATQAAQLGEALYRQSQFEEAARWASVAEGAAASDDASAQFSWRALRAKVFARAGEFEEARELADEAVAIAEGTDASTQHAHVLLDAAEVAALSGRRDPAVKAAGAAIRLLDAKGNVASGSRARSLLTELRSS